MSWDNEHFFVEVDGKRVASYRNHLSENAFHWCGGNSGWKSTAQWVDFTVYHTSSKASITFSSTLDERPDNESWGIRNFELSAEMCTGNCAVVTEEFMDDEFDED